MINTLNCTTKNWRWWWWYCCWWFLCWLWWWRRLCWLWRWQSINFYLRQSTKSSCVSPGSILHPTWFIVIIIIIIVNTMFPKRLVWWSSSSWSSPPLLQCSLHDGLDVGQKPRRLGLSPTDQFPEIFRCHKCHSILLSESFLSHKMFHGLLSIFLF